MPSPKELRASAAAVTSAAGSSEAPSTRRMPRPPPPADALTSKGNPIRSAAAMTVSRLFLAPLLVALQGRPWASALQWKECPTLLSIAPNGEREAILCADESSGGVRLLDGQNASDQARLALANSLVRLPPFAPAVPAGGIVQSLSF